jgi:hypothetical protein
MKAVVITSTHISIDGNHYLSHNFEAFCQGEEVSIRNIYDKDLVILHKTPYEEVTYNGAVELSAQAFVITFNAGITYYRNGEFYDIENKLDNILEWQDEINHILENSNYPTVPFSATLVANAEVRIANYAYPGYVTIKADGDNVESVYIGTLGLGAGSGELMPGESVAYEVADLSLLYALNINAGDHIYVFGAFRPA